MRALSFAVLMVAAGCASAQIAPHPAVDDVHILRSYRPGKNSFVEATARHAGHFTGKGFRYSGPARGTT